MNLSNEYLAGLFDGEGCVRILKNKWTKGHINPVYQVVVSISMTDKPIIIYLHRTFGGCFSFNFKKKPTHRTCFFWIIASQKAYNFLKQIYPYTFVKKKQIEIAFEFQEHINNCGRKFWNRNRSLSQDILDFRESCYQRIKNLKTQS